MSIKKLSDEQLVKEYKIARQNFVFSIEGTDQESEYEKLYDKLFKELDKRNIDLRKYIN